MLLLYLLKLEITLNIQDQKLKKKKK